MPWEPDVDISIESVQQTYRAAVRTGQFYSSFVPELESKPTNPRVIEQWDPYKLKAQVLPYALLDEEKLRKLEGRVRSTVARIPDATQWTATTEECRLTQSDLYAILRTSFLCNETPLTQDSQRVSRCHILKEWP